MHSVNKGQLHRFLIGYLFHTADIERFGNQQFSKEMNGSILIPTCIEKLLTDFPFLRLKLADYRT